MALPTLIKTWQISRNISCPPAGSTLAKARFQMRTLKNTLIGFGSGAWTVRGSSSSVAAGMDSVDRWAADADLVWNNSGSAHSWIVLRQTGIATNFELCIDLNQTFERSGSIIVSPAAGFTGGSTTARPTATDEIVLINNAEIQPEFDVQSYLNVWQSTDGSACRIVLWQANIQRMFWLFEKPRNPRASWANPSFSIVMSSAGGSSQAIFSNLFRAYASALGRSRIGTTTALMTCTGETAQAGFLPSTSPTATSANEIDLAWDMYPIGLATDTVGVRGRHGLLHDIWWAPTSVGQGDTAPNDSADRQFVKMGDLWLPWHPSGSTVPLLA